MSTIELNHAAEPWSPAAGPVELLERKDSLARALGEMQHLPANQQEVLRLKFQHGLAYKEIAAVTGLSETNIGFLIHMGLKTLRQRMTSPQRVSSYHGPPARASDSE